MIFKIFDSTFVGGIFLGMLIGLPSAFGITFLFGVPAPWSYVVFGVVGLLAGFVGMEIAHSLKRRKDKW